MAKRPRSKSDLEESQSAQGEVVVVAAEELAQAPVTVGNLPVEEGGSQLADDGLADVVAEDNMYSHPFWALLLRAGYTPVYAGRIRYWPGLRPVHTGSQGQQPTGIRGLERMTEVI